MKNHAKAEVCSLNPAMACAWITYSHAELASSTAEDLLVPNPNHASADLEDESESGEDGDEE